MPREAIIQILRANRSTIDGLSTTNIGELILSTDTNQLFVDNGASIVLAKAGFRNHTSATWTSNNPTLKLGEIGYESDTGKAKVGDGATAWTSLDYWTLGGEAAKVVVSASSDPGVGDDGYPLGTIWVREDTDEFWICVDNGTGAAVWNSGGGGISGPGTTVVNNVVLWNSTDGTVVKDGAAAIGTSANNLVQLNGSGELPAVSGANLTDLPASEPPSYVKVYAYENFI